MTFQEIETALRQRLTGLSPAYPIAWPNKDYDPTGRGNVPYIEFRHVPSARDDDSIDASMHVQTGIALLTVVVSRDAFTNQANDIAQSLASAFWMGLRLSAGVGQVMVTKPAELATGFFDGVYWRQPVRVNYRTVPAGAIASSAAHEGSWIDTLPELPS